MSENNKSLKATTLRVALTVILVSMLLGVGGGFYLAYKHLEESAQSTAQAQSEARSSDARVEQLRETERQLEINAEAVEKARQIVAESQSYQYQNQIIHDLTMYANKVGLSIRSFSFQGNALATGPSAPASTPGQPSTSAPTNSSANIKSVTVSVELAGNITYISLLNFIHLIEQNLTRMQVTSIALSGDAPSTQSGTSSQSLNIEVYVK